MSRQGFSAKRWRNNKWLTFCTQCFIKSVMVYHGFLILLVTWMIYVNASFNTDPEFEQDIKLVGLISRMLNLAGNVAFVAFAVSVMAWLYSSVSNAAVLGGRPAYRPYWAVAGFLIPVWWFFRPYQVAEDLWDVYFEGREPPVLVRVWWSAWLANIMIRIGLWVLPYGSLSIKATQMIEIGNSCLLLASLYCLSEIIRRLYRAQVRERELRKIARRKGQAGLR